MSYCEILSFKNGIPDDYLECRNSWGGAAYVWNAMYNKYLKNPDVEYDSWLFNSGALWKLDKDQSIPRFMRTVLSATYDNAIVRQANFKQYIEDLRAFVNYFGTNGNVCHLNTWAEYIEAHMDAEAIAFNATSVNSDQWRKWDDEIDDSVPYDLNKQDKHFEVYQNITEWEEYRKSEAKEKENG